MPAANTGPLATASWLLSRGLTPPSNKWNVQVTLRVAEAELRIELFGEEWGFRFEHADKVSWIRVTDLPFVHGRDEHELLKDTPSLKNFGALLHKLERRFSIDFDRDQGEIETSLRDAEPAIRDWLASL